MAQVSGCNGALRAGVRLALLASCLLVATVGGKMVAVPALNEVGCGTMPAGLTPGGLQPHHLPWLVQLGYKSGPKDPLVLGCIGTLINRRVVLTSAHCVHSKHPTSVKVRSCKGGKCEVTPRDFGVASVATHPAFSPLETNKANDIALVRLDKEIEDPSAGGNHAVCLPLAAFATASLLDSELGVAGWNIHENGTQMASAGSAGTLRAINVTAVADAECQRQFSQAGLKQHVQTSQLCAWGKGLEPCTGDSAAPLFTMVGSPPQATLAGILSLGSTECGNSSLPTLYTNVGAHLQWLRNTLPTL